MTLIPEDLIIMLFILGMPLWGVLFVAFVEWLVSDYPRDRYKHW